MNNETDNRLPKGTILVGRLQKDEVELMQKAIQRVLEVIEVNPETGSSDDVIFEIAQMDDDLNPFVKLQWYNELEDEVEDWELGQLDFYIEGGKNDD